MFGFIGKLAGDLVGGVLDKIGLGSIAPFVKLGLNAMTGNWLGVAQDVFGLISKFKGNPVDQAATRPPLGNFDQSSTQSTNSFQPDTNSTSSTGDDDSLGIGRLANLFKGLSGLLQNFSGANGGGNDTAAAATNGDDGLNKIMDALKTLIDSFSNNQLFNNRVSISQFTNIQA